MDNEQTPVRIKLKPTPQPQPVEPNWPAELKGPAPEERPISQEQPAGWKTFAPIALPALILVGVIALVAATGGAGLRLGSTGGGEDLSLVRTVMHPGTIDITIHNNSSQDVTISAVNIDDAIWPFHVSPSPTIPRNADATIHLDYPWVVGEPYAIEYFTSDASGFSADIDSAGEAAALGAAGLLQYLLLGLLVGIIPVALGMSLLPGLRRLDAFGTALVMAITIGLLIYLGIASISQGLDLGASLGGPFLLVGLIGIGGVASFLALAALSRRRTHSAPANAQGRLSLAYVIALGIGLHGLGEGMAVGAAASQGIVALSIALMIVLIIQNMAGGLAIVVPLLGDRSSLADLVLLGLLGGGPALLGALIGGLLPSQALVVLFAGIGAGAAFEVVYEISRLIRRELAQRPVPATVYSGIGAGLAALYVIGLIAR